MIKRMIIMLVLSGLVLGGVFGYKMFGYKMMMQHMAGMKNPPQTVSTIKVTSNMWKPEMRAVGTLRAVKGADLASEVQGIVDTIQFESGQDIEEGAVILQLRITDEVARLQSLEASARLAALTLERNEKQLKAQAVSQAVVDSDRATFEAAQAAVLQQKAVIAKKTIRAPFSGRLGIRNVDIGQFLNPGTAIVTLQQLDPIQLDFLLPQQALKQLQKGQKITAKTDTWPDKAFEGEITAINAKVDQATRNIQVQGTFKNAEAHLLPGMFATASISFGDVESHITVPQTAITFNPYGNTVYVVKKEADNTLSAQQVFVTTGDTRGDQVTILTGIKEGDEIVTAGQMKLANGSPIVINNSVQPKNDPDPKPKDY